MERIKSIMLIIIFVLIALLYYLHFTNKNKIAYVDNVRLIQGYNGYISAKAKLEKKQQLWQINIDTLYNELQTEINKYIKDSLKMSLQERRLTRNLIEQKQQQLVQYSQGIQEKVKNEENTMTNDILTQINAYVKEYSQKHGYSMVIGATYMGNLAYADQNLDITDKILEGLNKKNK